MLAEDPQFITEEQSTRDTYVALGLSLSKIIKLNQSRRKKEDQEIIEQFYEDHKKSRMCPNVRRDRKERNRLILFNLKKFAIILKDSNQI